MASPAFRRTRRGIRYRTADRGRSARDRARHRAIVPGPPVREQRTRSGRRVGNAGARDHLDGTGRGIAKTHPCRGEPAVVDRNAAGFSEERAAFARANHCRVESAEQRMHASEPRELVFLQLLLGHVDRDRAHHERPALRVGYRKLVRQPPALASVQHAFYSLVVLDHVVVYAPQPLGASAIPNLV